MNCVGRFGIVLVLFSLVWGRLGIVSGSGICHGRGMGGYKSGVWVMYIFQAFRWTQPLMAFGNHPGTLTFKNCVWWLEVRNMIADFQGPIGRVSGVSERISTRGIQKHHLRAHSRFFLGVFVWPRVGTAILGDFTGFGPGIPPRIFLPSSKSPKIGFQ